MNKIGLFLTLALILAVVFTGNVFAEDGVMKIAGLQGKVLVQRAGSNDWVAAKVGDVLNKNDIIKTLEDGLVYLEISPGIGFTLKPNAELIVDDMVKAPPLVAEPYSEPARETVNDVVAPEVNEESAASRI